MKRKIIKIALIVGGTLFLVFILVAVVVLSRVDSLVKDEIERSGPIALGVPTKIDSVHLSFLASTGAMDGLVVANPSGFSTPHFLKLEHAGIAISAQSLLEDRVVIPSLTFTGVDINLEEKDGKKNFDTIIANLKEFQKTLPESKSDSQGPGKKFVIQQIVIKDIKIHTDTLHGFGGKLQRVDIKIPEIVVKDIANDTDNGVAVSQVTGIIMTSLFQAIVTHGAGVLPVEVLGGIGKGVVELGKLGGESVKAIGDVVSGSAKSIGEAGKDTVDAVGKGVDEIGKGIGEIFDDKKKK